LAGSYAALAKVHGEPGWLELFLFLLGSSLGFAVVNTLSTGFFRRAAPDEPDVVVSLATALSAFSVCASVGAALGLAFAPPGWAAWPLCSAVFTLVYIVGVGAETALAADRHPHGGAEAEVSRRNAAAGGSGSSGGEPRRATRG